MSVKKIKRISYIQRCKAHGEHKGKKITMLTCYDHTFAKLINRTDIDMVLIGDSLGSVILGYDDTTKVRMRDMVYHTRAVAPAITRACVCVDMPFMSYSSTPQALRNAKRLMQAGAHAVKLEGGEQVCEQVKAIVDVGVPVLGHLGFTPQSVHALGGFVIQGKTEEVQTKILQDALALQAAGAFAIILELMPSALAATITSELRIPTIGIGAGAHCDGQVLVLYDMLGCDADFSPKFLKKYARLSDTILGAINAFNAEVRSGVYPDDAHSYD
ncbi:MAG: 3-methyl-2-oxobutanoate hydroxymethyltransferase [Pseudomonadota bacterium]|nr:3-methyl-2-oxobutanoate hydroxymethyltransferase [Pseudomonadota bacterium]